MIIGITGQAGSGKDTIALHLVNKYRFVRVGLADPLKRICKEVFDFSDDQLWGPSEQRNGPDKRYPRTYFTTTVLPKEKEGERTHYPKAGTPGFLTPRYALQTLGTEWGRDCYGNTWIDYGLRVAKELEFGYSHYTPQEGLIKTEKDTGICPGVVFSDLRFRNEIDAVKAAGGKLVRVKRPGFDGNVGVVGHASEEEQKSFTDDEFDFVIQNVGTIADLLGEADRMMKSPPFWQKPG